MSRGSDLQRVAGQGYWREAEARVVVGAWRRSGEPLSRFAGRCGVDARRIARWASRLGRSVAEPGARVRFHPVRLIGDGSRPGAFTIEVELAHGPRVRLAPGFDQEDLRTVLVVLEATTAC